MKQLKIKQFFLYTLVLFLFAACEKDSVLNESINQTQEIFQKTTNTSGKVAALVQQKSSTTNFEPINVFQNSRSSYTDAEVQQAVSEAIIMDIEVTSLTDIREREPEAIRMSLPEIKSQNFELDLVKVELFTHDFEAVDETGAAFRGDKGVHYRGIIKGDGNSLAAISIYEDQVMGFFSNEDGNYIVGQLKNRAVENTHLLYLDADMTGDMEGTDCSMPDDPGLTYSDEMLRGDIEYSNRAVGTVRVYVEVAEDIYYQRGSGTNGYITGLFNQSATLYANEDITIQLSSMFIWTSFSGYNSTSSSEQLSRFQNRYNNSNRFNGDIGHMVSFTGSGGIAAGFNGLCTTNVDESMCFSGIQNYYYNVPTYSWSVMVFTHEMGHLFGSRHTHACVWNGNNTAIDGCAGYVEGSCYNPGPVSGNTGTIMSYCHFNSGINFNYGFGSQPGNVIRYNVQNCGDDSGGGGMTGEARIRNLWSNTYLHQNGNYPGAAVSLYTFNQNWYSQRWNIEEAPAETYRLKCSWGGNYLNNTGDYNDAPVNVYSLNSNWWSQMWSIEQVNNDIYRFKNRWTSRYLHTGNQYNVSTYNLNSNWWSQMWVLEYIGTGTQTSNPTETIVDIAIPDKAITDVIVLEDFSEHTDYIIYDISGKVVAEGIGTTIDAGQLKSGDYLLTTFSKDAQHKGVFGRAVFTKR